MAVHKLTIDDFVTVDYTLIAIHTSLEDYRLAYFVNRELEIRLEKCPKDISFLQKESKAYFSRYTFEDSINDASWNLIQNKNTAVSTQISNVTLFSEAGLTVSNSAVFIPELKTVDYILKVENNETLNTAVVNSLLAIKYIATAYKINHYKLKSKNNLIF